MKENMQSPLVSIIVVNYNGEKYIQKCIASLLKTEYSPFELIVVDNNSTDKSIEIITEKFGKDRRLRIIRNTKNVGFAEGNNIGCRYSRGKYLAFINNDTEVDPNWLKELINVIENNSDVGACQSKLVLMGTHLLDGTGDFITVHGIAFIRGHNVAETREHQIEQIFSPRAAAMIINKRIFEKIGEFDSDYFAGYEDVDLGWRIRLLGKKVVFVPKSVVYHIGRASTKKMGQIEAYHKHKNCIATAIKNYNLRNLFFRLPFTIIYRFLLGISPFKETQVISQSGFAVIKAILWNITNFRKIWKKRLFVQVNILRVKDKDLEKLMLSKQFEINFLRWFLLYRKKYHFWKYLNQLIESDINVKRIGKKNEK